jgi:predicted nucleic acid-binding Zn finger protein
VDLEAGTCDCPHYRERLAGTGQACKHIKAEKRLCRVGYSREVAFISGTTRDRSAPSAGSG